MFDKKETLAEARQVASEMLSDLIMADKGVEVLKTEIQRKKLKELTILFNRLDTINGVGIQHYTQVK